MMFEPTAPSLWLDRRNQRHERNIPSALLCLVYVIVVASALAQPRWFYLRGGSCTRKFIGIQEYLFTGDFSLMYSELGMKSMQDCVTRQIVNVHRSIAFLCILSFILALLQFFMDLIGVKNKFMRPLRRNSISMILSSILIVINIGLCFYSTELMKAHQEKSKLVPTTAVQIDFGVSYYLLVGAGIIAIVTAGTNLLRRYPDRHVDDGEILLDDCQGETFNVALPHSRTWSNFRHPGIPELPPPPPYTP